MTGRTGRRAHVALIGGVLLAAAACQSQSASSPTPSGPSQSLVGETVSLCHRDAATGTFSLIAIARSEVGAHTAHGDGLLGAPVPGLTSMKFGVGCAVVPFESVVIGFDSLVTPGAPVVSHAESGYTVLPTVELWEASGHRHGGPNVIFRRPASAPAVDGELTITAGTSLFLFRSVDLYSSVTTIPYVIRGLRDGVPVLHLSAIVPNTFGKFETVADPSPAAPIDTLVIRLTNPATPCCSNPMGVDNLVLWR